MITQGEVAPQFPVTVPAGPVSLDGYVGVPQHATGIVVFAHGSGSGRDSPRNQAVARGLRQAGLATLLVDLLTPEEEAEDRFTARIRFDIDLLAVRLAEATEWLGREEPTAHLVVGYFGASTGAAAALASAARWSDRVGAVVSRGGRPDLAGSALARVYAPTLLIVGGADEVVLGLNEQALARLAAPEKRLEVIPGAGHLFEEPGALEEVTRLATEWFARHLKRTTVVKPR